MFKERKCGFTAIALIIAVFLCSCGISSPKAEKTTESTTKTALTTQSTALTTTQSTTLTTTQKHFENPVFFGNSFIETLFEYGIPSNAKYFYRVGLTVQSVFDLKMPSHNISVMDELNSGNYSQIFMFFGENELGWEYPDIFVSEYKKVVAAVKERQPDAKLYAIAVLPVSAEVSAQNIDETNNERIRLFNRKIEKMARDTGIGYIDPGKVLADENGDLPSGAAPDGVHIEKEQCEVMLKYIKDNL